MEYLRVSNSQLAGSQHAGSQLAGSQLAGSQLAGSQHAGSQHAGELKHIQRTPSLQSLSPTSSSQSPVFTPGRYVTKFHNGSKKGDDQILNTIILNKLNVFSVKTYDDVKQFLLQILGSDQKEFVRDFTLLVFKKAASEDKFCGLYAKLLSDIKEVYPVILEEMKRLHQTYLQIWDTKQITTSHNRLGYSLFLAELFALNVLDSETLRLTCGTLKTSIHESMHSVELKEMTEEYINCLRQLCCSKVLKHSRILIKDLLLEDMNEWITKSGKEAPGISNKSKFTCMDLRDLLQI